MKLRNVVWSGLVVSMVLAMLSCAVKRGVYHEVQRGQTLWKISQAYNVDLDLILRANDIHNASQVRAGTRLFIPGAATTRSVPSYEVARGESGDGGSTSSSPPAPPPPRDSGGSETTSNSDQRDDSTGGTAETTENFQPVWPCEGRIVSRFDKGGDPTKRGIMMHVPPNSPVKAMESGTVRIASHLSEPRELEQFGNLVMIFHNDNFVSVYAHLDKINIEKGDNVNRGQVIGSAGSTGYVDQASCYFQIRYKVKPRDPLLFLGEPA